MIRIPKCYACKYYNHNKNNCPAHPEGLTDEVIKTSTDLDESKECAPGIKFKRI